MFEWMMGCFALGKEKRMDDAAKEIQKGIAVLNKEETKVTAELEKQQRTARYATDAIEVRTANQMAEIYQKQIESIQHGTSVLAEEFSSIQRAKTAKTVLKKLKTSDGAKSSYY